MKRDIPSTLSSKRLIDQDFSLALNNDCKYTMEVGRNFVSRELEQIINGLLIFMII